MPTRVVMRTGNLFLAVALAGLALAGACGGPNGEGSGGMGGIDILTSVGGSTGNGRETTGAEMSTSTGDPGCNGPLGAPQDPSTLPACCPDFPGHAACEDISKIADPKVKDGLTKALSMCDSGGACVPDEFVKTGGVFTPKSCAAINGAGVCASLCIPQVAMYKDLLKQDVCEAWERCAPCISPLDMMPTGVCDIHFACNDGASSSTSAASSSSGGMMCPHMGPPVVDPNSFPPCPASVMGCSTGGHCLPTGLVPPAEQSQLADCDAANKCVPDTLIASGGNFIPPTCKSVGGIEGRCLSTCLPSIEAQASLLPQDSCQPGEKCAPCWDPQHGGMATGACNLSCDPGPDPNGPKTFPQCCMGIGECVPGSAVPQDQAKQLGQDVCPDATMLCVPYALEPGGMNHGAGDHTNEDCDTSFLLQFIGATKGKCLPACVPATKQAGQGSCPSDFNCVPCKGQSFLVKDGVDCP